MREGLFGRVVAAAALNAAVAACLLLTAIGCHAKSPMSRLGIDEENSQLRQIDGVITTASSKKVGGAGAEIVAACATEPFINARKGLIVTETGLNEDVLDLRDRTSYKAVPFGLNEALRLETLLRDLTTAPSHSKHSAQQMQCIGEFADHIQSLTDPLVEADREQKQLDVSAFNNAAKEAQQEMELDEKAVQPSPGTH
jgi:hypothetical protein